ncbi:M48 family metallopeptidase [Lichenihabitans sp. Uapishka_5]|uniref:M48 family metallopeptidase n=1 Tax=Lichenihabitans sp. Uapishka_5 TaxID=3037302 RepID=UPI0029E81115|nr:M48 family metallopeptidase [Lichenihabitans sp. Uapishka_5]MDX7953182.1 M48 family metallopeptidase [Lichenihabitans sp. Uapishka_5]
MLIAFVAATLFWAGVALVLSHRQVVHVLAHRGNVPADFEATVTLAEHQKAADYTVARERLARLDTILDTAVTLAWVGGGIAALYGALAGAVPPSLTRGVLFFLATIVIRSLVGLPLDLYRVFRLEARFGFNQTTRGTFVADRLKGAVIGLAVAVPLLYGALWVMGRFQGLWWLWAWIVLVALMVVAPAVYVRLVAPRFNRFLPLEDGPLRARIEALLGEAGFRSSGLFTMDASRRSTHGNAFFIGFGRAKRIVLFDTLLSRSGTEEVAAVVAHELGHFRHRHVVFGLAQGAATLLVGLAAFGWLCQQPWLLAGFGIAWQDHALDLFVCLLLASVVGPLLTPITNWISRRNEFQADDYARRAVGATPMISALTGLARDNASTLTPDPVYALAHYSHPPVPVRVRQLRRAAATA